MRSRAPSPQYLQVILEGAIEHMIDDEYIDQLRGVKTNGNTVITEGMRKALKYNNFKYLLFCNNICSPTS